MLLPLVIGTIMFGLGLHLRTDDFRRVLRTPRPVFIGLLTQLLVLPPIAFALCLVFALPAEIAVGFMLLVASPGGATANVFSHLARGDVALNITLTALNSVLILLTLPLIVGWSMAYFLAEQGQIPAPTRKVIEVAVIILLPVAIGMLVRGLADRIADRLERWVKPLSLITLLALIVITVAREWNLIMTHAAMLGLACLLLSVLSLSIGYGTGRLLRLDARQSIAIAFEIGIHNTTLAIFIALSVLKLLRFPYRLLSTVWLCISQRVRQLGGLYAGQPKKCAEALMRKVRDGKVCAAGQTWCGPLVSIMPGFPESISRQVKTTSSM